MTTRMQKMQYFLLFLTTNVTIFVVIYIAARMSTSAVFGFGEAVFLYFVLGILASRIPPFGIVANISVFFVLFGLMGLFLYKLMGDGPTPKIVAGLLLSTIAVHLLPLLLMQLGEYIGP